MNILELVLIKNVFYGIKLVRRESQELYRGRDRPPSGNAEKIVDLPDITAIVFLDDSRMDVVELLIAVFIFKINKEIFMGRVEFFGHDSDSLAVLIDIGLTHYECRAFLNLHHA